MEVTHIHDTVSNTSRHQNAALRKLMNMVQHYNNDGEMKKRFTEGSIRGI
jgi:microcompartment protein CcmK/EutM